MKKTKAPLLIMLLAVLLHTGTAYAQKDPPNRLQQIADLKKEKINVIMPITKEMENQVSELTRPLREQMKKILEADNTGTYKKYLDEVGGLKEIKEHAEKMKRVKEIEKKYYPFFKKNWDAAKIDEPYYQAKIKNIFPPEQREQIHFQEFLGFISEIKSQNHTEPPPAPGGKCIDASTLFFAAQQGAPGGIARSGSVVTSSFVNTDAMAEFVGFTSSLGVILSNITIPGTFPQDNKQLRIIKTYTWSGSGFAIAVIGCSFTTISHGVDNFSNIDFYRVWAPVIFINSLKEEREVTDNTLVAKRFMMNIRFGVKAYADCIGEFIGAASGSSWARDVHWTVCEE